MMLRGVVVLGFSFSILKGSIRFYVFIYLKKIRIQVNRIANSFLFTGIV
jgi:hypothetical protein